jgi:hypothetical protein
MSLSAIQETLQRAFGNTLAPGLAMARNVEHRSSSRSYDPATGLAARTETAHPRPAIVTSFTMAEIAQSDGLIERGDRMIALMPGPNLPVPKVDDRIVLDGASYVIVEVDHKALGATPLVYRCQCREGN